jgi:hypothetical protein
LSDNLGRKEKDRVDDDQILYYGGHGLHAT